MNNESRAHGNKGYVFKFNNRDELLKFVLMYKDLFVPYSDYMIKTDARVTTRTYRTKNGTGRLTSDGYIDDNVAKMMEQGYKIYDGNNIRVNLKKEGFDEIISSGLFEKFRVRRSLLGYQLKAV